MSIEGSPNVDLSSAISVAVARKALDAQRREGDALVRMLRDAAAVGSKPAGQSHGAQGGRLDVYA